MVDFVTSDLHLQHKLVSGLRGFGTPDKHDEAIVNTWNKVVGINDHTWILGDLTLRKLSAVRDTLDRLNGSKSLVLGNHDVGHPLMRGWKKHYPEYYEVFDYVGTVGTVRWNGEVVFMSHFPYYGDHVIEGDRYQEWRLPDVGNILLHGHTHSNDWDSGGRQVHVGWDTWGEPVRLDYAIGLADSRNG